MEKPRWLEFLSSRLRSQISIENAEKAQTWAFAFLSLVALGFALQSVGAAQGNPMQLYPAKVLFLILFHPVMILAFYLPGLLQKEEKPGARLLNVKDFTSLTSVSLILAFYAAIVLVVSFQAAAGSPEMAPPPFLGVVAWINFIFSLFYLAACVFYFSALLWFPQALVKMLERSPKSAPVFLSLHTLFFLLLAFGYSELIPFGSAAFLEQFRTAGLFWIFIGASVFLIGKLLSESSIPALASLELEVASGQLERNEEVLERLKEAFVSKRLFLWVNRLSHRAATQAHEIAQLTHDAISVVGREKPTEIDLRLVEDRYRRADQVSNRLEKENQRFLLSASFFDSSDAEREKIEELRDLFSREMRNAKLELASIRKRIDERLVSLKNSQPLPQIVHQQKALPEKIPAAAAVAASAK